MEQWRNGVQQNNLEYWIDGTMDSSLPSSTPIRQFSSTPIPSCLHHSRFFLPPLLHSYNLIVKKDDLFKFIATIGPLGYSPVAPGTVGSVLSCLIYILFRPDVLLLSIIIPIGFIAGVLVSDRTERLLNEKDSSHIVVDELVGYLVSVFLIPFSIPNAVLAFLLFRAFDIVKPTPIRQLERRIPGGLGIMIDDILAGVYANLVLRLILVISKG